MSNSTPMKSLRVQLENLLNNMESSTRCANLNKKEPSSYYNINYKIVETNGVTSDFIRIFSNPEFKDVSFAFSFSYINVESGKETVHIVIKDINKPIDQIYTSSKVLFVEEMRDKLKELNREMKLRKAELNNDISISNTISLIKNVFNMDDVEDCFNEFVTKFKTQNKQNISDLKIFSEQLKTDNENYYLSLVELDNRINELPEQAEIKKLKSQIASLEYVIKIKAKKQREELKIDTKYNSLLSLKKTIINLNNETIDLFRKFNQSDVKYRFNENQLVKFIKRNLSN